MYFYVSTNVINIRLALTFTQNEMIRRRHLWAFAAVLLIFSCDTRESKLLWVTGRRIVISDSLSGIDSIDLFVQPYKNRIDQVLDEPLAYNPEIITENDGVWNTSAGNLMADIVMEMADTIFYKRTGKHIDLAVLNHGGVRAGLPTGMINARNAYEMMPFENNIYVIEMTGKEIRNLVTYLVSAQRPNPISGAQIILDNTGNLEAVNIQNRPFDESRSYRVATSSYLVDGGSDMGFFPSYSELTDLEYKLRNAIIDYFKKVDTVQAVVDDRFYQLQ